MSNRSDKQPRGFATLSVEKRREISRAGGIAAHYLGRGHEWTPETAAVAGKKGGLATAITRRALKVTSGLQAGGLQPQHNRLALKVRTAVKAGFGVDPINHNRRLMVVGW